METDSNAKRAQLTQAELTQLLAGMECNGVLVTLSPAANEIIERLHVRLTSDRKPRVTLRNPAIMRHYKGLMLAELDDNLLEIGAGGELISEYDLSDKIGLGANTIHNNPTLHGVYERYKQTVCRVRPATVSYEMAKKSVYNARLDDDDDYLDNDF